MRISRLRGSRTRDMPDPQNSPGLCYDRHSHISDTYVKQTAVWVLVLVVFLHDKTIEHGVYPVLHVPRHMHTYVFGLTTVSSALLPAGDKNETGRNHTSCCSGGPWAPTQSREGSTRSWSARPRKSTRRNFRMATASKVKSSPCQVKVNQPTNSTAREESQACFAACSQPVCC